MQRIMHPFSPLPSIPTVTSSSDAKISPAILLVIVILAIIFFSGGLIHLLVRFFVKRPSIYSFSSSGRYSENAASDAIQRQLQQLFRLHDSGLDQDIIDALPVFSYKDIVGLKESSDCAVCLCEFSDQDQLRLLPVCSHAFHVNCIDMWLLSNSTCPLCRNTLVSTDYSLDFSREFPIGQSNDGGSVHSVHDKPGIMEEERVYSVRLGKLRSTIADNEEISSSNLNARRCYSMGSREYVIGDPDLMVKTRSSQNSDSIVDGDVEAKRISCSNKGESFSISKIWQWSKKTSSSDTNLISGGPFHSVLPLTNKVQAVDENI